MKLGLFRTGLIKYTWGKVGLIGGRITSELCFISLDENKRNKLFRRGRQFTSPGEMSLQMMGQCSLSTVGGNHL